MQKYEYQVVEAHSVDCANDVLDGLSGSTWKLASVVQPTESDYPWFIMERPIEEAPVMSARERALEQLVLAIAVDLEKARFLADKKYALLISPAWKALAEQTLHRTEG